MDGGVECEGLEQGPAGERLRGEERRGERRERRLSALSWSPDCAPPRQTRLGRQQQLLPASHRDQADL